MPAYKQVIGYLFAIFAAGLPLLVPMAIGAVGFRLLAGRSWRGAVFWVLVGLAAIVMAVHIHKYGGQTTDQLRASMLSDWIIASAIAGIAVGAVFAATAGVLGRYGWLISWTISVPIFFVHGFVSWVVLLSHSGWTG